MEATQHHLHWALSAVEDLSIRVSECQIYTTTAGSYESEQTLAIIEPYKKTFNFHLCSHTDLMPVSQHTEKGCRILQASESLFAWAPFGRSLGL